MKTRPSGEELKRSEFGRLSVRPLSESWPVWHGLLTSFAGAVLYHRDAWIELLSRAHGFPMWLAALERDGCVVAASVFARSHNPFARRFVSLPFSDSCPPLARDGGAARGLLDALASQDAAGAVYEIRGIEGGASWETVNCFVDWKLDLQRPLAKIESGLSLNFRRNLRRARTGIKLERGSQIAHLQRFYAVQLESRRRLGIPPQPWRFFELARELLGPESFDIWLACEGREDAAAVIFIHDGDAVHLKWSARRAASRSNAHHLLMWSAIEEFARSARVLELGRADIRNQGLMRFKQGLGATSTPLPYSFFPLAPRQVSPEVLTGAHRVFARLWSRLPIFATRLLGGAVYRFLG